MHVNAERNVMQIGHMGYEYTGCYHLSADMAAAHVGLPHLLWILYRCTTRLPSGRYGGQERACQVFGWLQWRPETLGAAAMAASTCVARRVTRHATSVPAVQAAMAAMQPGSCGLRKPSSVAAQTTDSCVACFSNIRLPRWPPQSHSPRRTEAYPPWASSRTLSSPRSKVVAEREE